MKKFTGLLLCTSIVLFSVLFLSGCENNNDISGEISETVSTVPNSAVSVSETETAPQTSKTETSETTEATTQQTAETTLAETELSVSTPTEEKSIYQQCIESFTAEKADLGAEYIYDTEVYDIDNDGTNELLILYYGIARGSDLYVYKMYDDSFAYCGCIYSIMCKLNEHIYDFPIYTPEFYDKIDKKI